jgi:putative endonuclease
MDRRSRGRWAENAVAAWLEDRGYRILDRNVYLQRGELDVVAWRDEVLWFVECRSRGRADRGAPHHSIDARKKRTLYAAAREYLWQRRFEGDYGFLVASVLPDPRTGSASIEVGVLPISP